MRVPAVDPRRADGRSPASQLGVGRVTGTTARAGSCRSPSRSPSAGSLLAWLTYQRGAIDPARLAAALGPLDFMARRRYGLDALYAGLYRGFLLGFSRLIGWIDRYLVDGVLNVLERLVPARGAIACGACRPGRRRTTSTAWPSASCSSCVWAQWWQR